MNSSNHADHAKIVYSLVSFLLSNYKENYTITQLSKKFQLPSSTLRNFFSTIAGLSIHDFIIQTKMVKGAELLLAEENYTIEHICKKIGYKRNAFNRAFKKHFNLTPRLYKAQHLNDFLIMSI